jgi:Uma2 family endonuclease
MEEYMEAGAQLGWLIDPIEKKVYVYRPGVEVTCLEEPERISGDPVLPGCVLDVQKVFS